MLHLYILRGPAADYGQPESLVVAAVDQNEARLIAGRHIDQNYSASAFAWVDPDKSTVDLIGTADPAVEAGVVLSAVVPG